MIAGKCLRAGIGRILQHLCVLSYLDSVDVTKMIEFKPIGEGWQSSLPGRSLLLFCPPAQTCQIQSTCQLKHQLVDCICGVQRHVLLKKHA